MAAKKKDDLAKFEVTLKRAHKLNQPTALFHLGQQLVEKLRTERAVVSRIEDKVASLEKKLGEISMQMVPLLTDRIKRTEKTS